MRLIELHSPVRIVQRSKGQTATAAAAYRSGTRIECERTGEIHDYTRKQGIELTALLFPADTPESIQDRQDLWNAAESREKHPRAQTARDLEVSFPAEFSPEQRREAGLVIGNLLIERYGVAADLCWHKPSRNGDERNFHLHALFTTRRFENGDWAKNKDRTLDDLYGKGAEEVINLRQGIADVLNNIAARDGLQIYVEHLSFEKRGIDREPTQHLGKYASRLEQRGEQSEIGDKNREIKARNAEREMLHVKRKAVITEIEQAELEAKGQGRSQTPPQMPKNSPQMRESDLHRSFYQETQKRRQELLRGIDDQYSQQEREAQQQLTQLFNSVSQPNRIIRFWRDLIGKTRKDEEAIDRLRANLENIQKRKQEAFAAFEKDRQTRLEALKSQFLQKGEFSEETERQKSSVANAFGQVKQDNTPEEQALQEKAQRIEQIRERMNSRNKSHHRGRGFG